MVRQIDMFAPADGYTGSDDLVVPTQCPIEVFTNKAGGVTIRQDQTAWMGDAVFVAMAHKDAVRAVIVALQREIGDAA